MSFFSDRNIDHGWIGAYGSGPCYGDDVAVAALICAAYHDCGKGIQKVAGLVEFNLAHFDHPFFSYHISVTVIFRYIIDVKTESAVFIKMQTECHECRLLIIGCSTVLIDISRKSSDENPVVFKSYADYI